MATICLLSDNYKKGFKLETTSKTFLCILVPFNILIIFYAVGLACAVFCGPSILNSFHCLAAKFVLKFMWFSFTECQREKEKKSLQQQILKDDLTLNGLELYCCMSRDISSDNSFYKLQCAP